MSIFTTSHGQSTENLRTEVKTPARGTHLANYFAGIGYKEQLTAPIPIARATAFRSLMARPAKHVYENDLIVGSMRGLFDETVSAEDNAFYTDYANRYGQRGWLQGRDHFAPAYDRLLTLGVDGILAEIDRAKAVHHEPRKQEFLEACAIAMRGFSEMIEGYADAAADPDIAWTCRQVAHHVPQSFREALQLVWFGHTAFLYQGLYAMALGRIDQYLYPFYRHDIASGALTQDGAQLLLENVFMKIGEYRTFLGCDDVCNICIAGVTPDGEDATNDLTYAVLRAVGRCNIPGPNLSARISVKTPDALLEEAMGIIGTGLGYPALMNDEVNVAALKRMGYAERDANNYCMVGCIENFLPGLQPPWTDGRFDNVKLLEYTLNRGRDLTTGKRVGIDTGDPRSFATMGDFIHAYERQLSAGCDEYVCGINLQNAHLNNANFVNPFMSCLSYECIERGLDICDGGSHYPSAHGAAIMGIGTVTDSLSAIEQCIYVDRSMSWDDLLSALAANFEGYGEIREKLLAAPKYGNDDDFADKHAVWFVAYCAGLFDAKRMPDGGRYYIGMASNISNIDAGAHCAATPDGRLAGKPQSDAASPTYGKDCNGPTATVKSVTKPDYTLVALGTVINQKYPPNIFETQSNLKRLCALVRVYFERGGQEMQINSVSREMLVDAMKHPDDYRNLVVRVSGFSAYYVTLAHEVQLDILSRTEQAGS